MGHCLRTCSNDDDDDDDDDDDEVATNGRTILFGGGRGVLGHVFLALLGCAYASFGQMPSQIKISLNGVELNQWLPS